MSLVHQALRKAEAEKHRHAAPPPAPVAPAAVAPHRPASPVSPTPAPAPTVPARPSEPSAARLLPVALIALAAVAIVALVVIALRTGPVVRETIPMAAEPRPVEAATAPRPAEPPPSAERWKLTGISKDPAGNYLAIINGSLRGVNEYVDGAVIKHIERDRVTLDVQGQETVLRLF